jgi:hypothetical protein
MTRAAGASTSDELIAEIRREFPSFRIAKKRVSTWMRVIDVLLKVLTFGAQREFISRYHTVLFGTLYVPDAWDTTPDRSRMITLRHERVHLRQRRRYGDVGLTFLYLIPFFPLGLAYGRARIEWEAYVETLRATAQYAGLDAARAPELRAYIVRQFTEGAYGWMWPFSKTVHGWYDAALRQIEREARWSERESGGEKQS